MPSRTMFPSCHTYCTVDDFRHGPTYSQITTSSGHILVMSHGPILDEWQRSFHSI